MGPSEQSVIRRCPWCYRDKSHKNFGLFGPSEELFVTRRCLFYSRHIVYMNFVECYNYTSLTEPDRKPSYNLSKNPQDDISLGPGWFRFEGDAGSTMATSCPPKDRCNTAATGWLNGTHPEVADGNVTREACFSYSNGCCDWKTSIQVRNCSSYVVYFLNSVPYLKGDLRYCSSD